MTSITYTWADFDIDVGNLVKTVIEHGKNFSGIYAIPRGGLPLAVRLSHELDLPIILGGVDRKVLVVDDIADTGRTLEPYRKRGCAILTLFKHKLCPFTPTYYAREAVSWVVFPWERIPGRY